MSEIHFFHLHSFMTEMEPLKINFVSHIVGTDSHEKDSLLIIQFWKK